MFKPRNVCLGEGVVLPFTCKGMNGVGVNHVEKSSLHGANF